MIFDANIIVRVSEGMSSDLFVGAEVANNISSEGYIETIFYRSRFEIYPEDVVNAEIWPQIVSVLQSWIAKKEERNHCQDIADSLKGDIVDYSSTVDSVQEKCPLSEAFAKGELAQGTPDSRLITAASFQSENDVIPLHWAMRYIELDNRSHRSRKWRTDVGVSRSGDGIYAVNSSITILDSPVRILDSPAIPARNVPRFVTSLLELKGCLSFAGDAPLHPYARPITLNSIDEYIGSLFSERRTVPLVTLTSDRYDGENFLMDPDELASVLRGIAVVYKMDRSDNALYKTYEKEFGRGQHGYEYRANCNSLRVFLPNVNIEDPDDHFRHKFYNPEQLERIGTKGFKETICTAATRITSRTQGEATSILSVKALDRRKTLQGKIKNHLAEQESAADKVDHYNLQIDDVTANGESDDNQIVKNLSDELEKAKSEIKDYQELIDSLEEDLKERDKLRVENSKLEDMIEARDAKAESLISHNEKLKKRLSAIKEDNNSLSVRASILDKLDKFPDSVLSALELAAKVYSNRIVVTEKALVSARGFDGDANEAFVILRALATNMWEILYGKEQSADMEQRFKLETNLEVSFNESSQTQSNSKMMAMRTIDYNGEKLDITWHVKGKSGRKDASLRVHFAKDTQNKKIVIGHCGAHMETAGTRRKF